MNFLKARNSWNESLVSRLKFKEDIPLPLPLSFLLLLNMWTVNVLYEGTEEEPTDSNQWTKRDVEQRVVHVG